LLRSAGRGALWISLVVEAGFKDQLEEAGTVFQ